jgi:hypothetical protein
MLFQRSFAKPSCLHTPWSSFCRSILPLLLVSGAAATLSAQTTPPPTAPAPSSSSDVQQAQVAPKAKDLYSRDVALTAFGQDTNRTNGNSIRNGTTASVGGMLSYRQSPRWWFGYEVNYGYTKYNDTYYYDTYHVKHNSNELTLAYLMKSPSYGGFRVFGTMAPTSYGGVVHVILGTPATQTVPMFVYSLGAEKQLTSRLGVRAQFRDDVYKDPDFKQQALDTTRLRNTLEPGIGVYYRF